MAAAFTSVLSHPFFLRKQRDEVVETFKFFRKRPRKDHRGVDLISDALPFGRRRTKCNQQCNRIRNASDSQLAVAFLWSLRRGFVSCLDCILLAHVFALPRRAVKTRAF